MADIELGAYVTEIEEMLSAERNAEAVAHCRHILGYFPKNLAVYRSLGKGLLELGRLRDAADILTRVLGVAPDDFVAHIGMAIISEEEGDLDRAIAHMERAFETQSSNPAIHSELKRLYGRRDGVEPNKVHMSRGALARLYIKGGNYSRAVEELRAALNDDPGRVDWQVLLARALWKDEQRIAAVEACQDVLEKLPNCLEADSILYEIWQSTGREDEAAGQLQRVEVLDPQLAHVLKDPAGSAQPPKLKIPQLDYVAPSRDEVMGIPDWVRRLGLGEGERPPATIEVAPETEAEPLAVGKAISPEFDGESETVPDWLRDMASSDDQVARDLLARDTEAVAEDEEATPDWLLDIAAGEDEVAQEPVIVFDRVRRDTTWKPPSDDHDQDIPEWLAEAVEWRERQAGTPSGHADSDLSGDWLSELTEEEPELAEAGEPSAGAETLIETSEPPERQQEVAGHLEKTAAHVSSETPAGPAEAMLEPDTEIEAESISLPAEDIVTAETDLEALEAALSASGEAIPRLQELSIDSDTAVDEARPDDDGVAIAAEDIPDWLREVAGEPPPEVVELAKSPATPSDQEFGAEPLVPSESDELPAWLQELGRTAEPPTTVPAPSGDTAEAKAQLPFEIPPWLGGLLDQEEVRELGAELAAMGTEGEAAPAEPEDAMAWLKQASERVEATPEGASAGDEALAPLDSELPAWLTEPFEELEGVDQSAPLADLEPALDLSEMGEMPEDVDDAMAWLEELAARQDAQQEELPTKQVETAEASREEQDASQLAAALWSEEGPVPEWLQHLEPEPVDAGEEIDLPDLLQESATERPGAELEESPIPAPATIAGESELPDWLREPVSDVTESGAEPGPVVEEPELPEWLREPVHGPAEEGLEEAELPDWLREPAPEVADTTSERAEAPEWLRGPTGDLRDDDAEEAELPAWHTEAELDGTAVFTQSTVDEVPEPPERLRAQALDLTEEELEEEDLPDWLRQIVPAEDEAKAEPLDLPEWMRGPAIEPEREVIEEAQAPELSTAAQAADAQVAEPAALAEEIDIPDWLREPVTKEAASEVDESALPEWLREPALESGVEEVEEAEAPDWLAEAEVEGEPAVKPVAITDDSELPEWLTQPAPDLAEEGVEEEPIPEWLTEPEVSEQPPEIPSTIAEDQELPEWLREPAADVVTEGTESAESLGWLHEPILEPPDDTVEEAELPEWLSEAEAVEPFAAEPTSEVEEPGRLEYVHEPAREPLRQETEELPEWMRELIVEKPAEEIQAPFLAEPPVTADEYELPEWLQEPALSLAEQQITEPPEWMRQPPAEVAKARVEEESTAEAPGDVEEPAVPYWLLEPGLEEPEAAIEEPVDVAPASLAEEMEEPEWEREAAGAATEEPRGVDSDRPAPEEALVPLADAILSATESGEALAPDAEPAISEAEKLATPDSVLPQRLASSPEDSAERLAQARALRADGNLDQALDTYSELVTAGQDLEIVVEELEDIVQSSPVKARAGRVLGDAYMRQNKLTKALEAYRQALDSL